MKDKLYLCIDQISGDTDKICKGLKGLQAFTKSCIETFNQDKKETDEDYVKANTSSINSCIEVLKDFSYNIFVLDNKPFSYVDTTRGLIINHNVNTFETGDSLEDDVVYLIDTKNITFNENNTYSIV